MSQSRFALSCLIAGLLAAETAHASGPPITEPRDVMETKPMLPSQAARRATLIPVAIGVAMVGGAALGAADSGLDALAGPAIIAGLGFCSFTGGVILGPELGWSRVGQPARGGLGIAARTALIAGGITVAVKRGNGDASAGGIVVGAVTLALAEALYEVERIRREERAPVALRLGPAWTRSGAPALALTARF